MQNILLLFQMHSPPFSILLCALGRYFMDPINGFLDLRLWWKLGRQEEIELVRFLFPGSLSAGSLWVVPNQRLWLLLESPRLFPAGV